MTNYPPPTGSGHLHYESAVPDPDTSPFEGVYELPEWSGPTPVMVRALELVQADVDAAGLSFRLSYEVAGGSGEYPIVNVQWRGTWTSDSIDLDTLDLADATVDVARQLTQGLIELEDVYLPTCPSHGNWASACLSHRRAAEWMCTKRGVTPHVLAAVGELQLIPAKIRSKGPLWRNLADLGPP